MTLLSGAGILVSIVILIILAAIAMVASTPRSAPVDEDVFGFATLQVPPDAELPPLLRYPARDGEPLAYRFYDSSADQILIFIHGSSYHGRSYHALARAVSASGAAKVILPNLRGHYQSGRHRGDVEYIGQFEDDIADLIAELRRQNRRGPIVLGGHSSGGGFVVRFAGGAHGHLVSRFLASSPVIPASPTLRTGSSGGWAQLHMRRLIGLVILNAFGIRGFNALPVIDFNKPARFWDGTETLSYSYRLTTSYHPRQRYVADLRKLADKAIVLIGEHDEAVDAERLQTLFARESPASLFKVLPDTNHFGIFTSAAVLDMLIEWLAQPAQSHSSRTTSDVADMA
ncbi:alpha-beta hydrolase superfamily lysophospholipase [Paraburkholderia unamae]|uniref:alpha/beta hydrolase n=1 Tax=Paraburkholderia unamae TaxID=219649 RepID=UPI000DC45E5A|nr:alpha/beta fold hydrolase [Paraburkholderia unamae]RAR65938.1 alpha-beta hydrolase superfamily lysophospholipase [Paraburkholderia unamae]